MREWLYLFAGFLRDLVRSPSELRAENAALRQQLSVLLIRAPKQLHLRRSDRLLLTLIWRFVPDARKVIRIVRPETLVRWHRMGFRAL
jgi:hypothetical protein